MLTALFTAAQLDALGWFVVTAQQLPEQTDQAAFTKTLREMTERVQALMGAVRAPVDHTDVRGILQHIAIVAVLGALTKYCESMAEIAWRTENW